MKHTYIHNIHTHTPTLYHHAHNVNLFICCFICQNFTVFSIPVGVIYRPPEGKLKNVKTKDYLGKAKLVAAVDPADAFVGFTGAQQQKVC